MSGVFDRVQYLCNLNNITINALETSTGLNHGLIQKWKSNEKIMPSSATLVLIADYFHVSVDYLLGRCDNPTSHIDAPALCVTTKRVLEIYKKMDTAIKNAETELKQVLAEQGITEKLQ